MVNPSGDKPGEAEKKEMKQITPDEYCEGVESIYAKQPTEVKE